MTMRYLAGIPVLLLTTGLAGAQQTAPMAAPVLNPPLAQQSPAGAGGGLAGGDGSLYPGYAPSARLGMYVGGGTPANAAEAAAAAAAGVPQDIATNPPAPATGIPGLSDGRVLSAEKIDGFNQAVEENFPMTPEMVRQFRDIKEEQDRALAERAEPQARVDAAFISLEPGEVPAEFKVAPGIASVINFHDVTGQPWPITKLVLGNGENFQAVQLGEESSSVAITPLVRFGWTNLIVVLRGQSKPVVMRVTVSEQTAHFSLDIQIMDRGPNAVTNTATNEETVREAGSELLLGALTGVDLPADAKPVSISGVDARAWLVGGQLVIRSRHALLTPSWQESMSGPDGIHVYSIAPSSFALFSVNGSYTRAEIALP